MATSPSLAAWGRFFVFLAYMGAAVAASSLLVAFAIEPVRASRVAMVVMWVGIVGSIVSVVSFGLVAASWALADRSGAGV